MLVQKRVFKTVYISRLPVGHTHEDIDAKFAVISKHLSRKNYYTIQEYLKEILVALRTSETPTFVEEILWKFNYSSWLKNFLDQRFSFFSHSTTESGERVFKFDWSETTSRAIV